MRISVVSIIILVLYISTACAKIEINNLGKEITDAVNLEREKLGYYALPVDERLVEVATQHSKNMAKHDFFAHKDHQGKLNADRISASYPELIYYSVSENLACIENARSNEMVISEAINGWHESPPHRKAMLEPSYTHTGVGVAVKGNKVYVTQLFSDGLVRSLSPIPKSTILSRELNLKFEYLGKENLNLLKAYLRYPDEEMVVQVEDNFYTLGNEPLKLMWTDDKTFRIRFRFKGGKGLYRLSFGLGGSFLENDYKIIVN